MSSTCWKKYILVEYLSIYIYRHVNDTLFLNGSQFYPFGRHALLLLCGVEQSCIDDQASWV